ncbi:MAG TPA: cupin domain-containing protein [Chloroflexota bacterium]|nr:cupin domain-containing protein [Chloroflexota bacterium]
MIERVPRVDGPRRRLQETQSHDVGPLLRGVREGRGLSLSQLSRMCGLTRSFLSQVESNQASPSVASLQKIVSALDMTLGDLFQPPSEPNPVVRKAERRRIHYPGLELEDELLVPGMRGKLQVMHSRVEPHGSSGDEPYVHDADEECVIVLTGALEMDVDGIEYCLDEGDTITFCSRLPHSWRNPLDRTTECIWVITPPGF